MTNSRSMSVVSLTQTISILVLITKVSLSVRFCLGLLSLPTNVTSLVRRDNRPTQITSAKEAKYHFVCTTLSLVSGPLGNFKRTRLTASAEIWHLHDGVICLPCTTRIVWEFYSLFRFLFPHENSKTIGTNESTKESRQSILVVVVKWRHHAI
jgi:hypothetical protein